MRNIETGPFEAKAIENGLYDALKAGVSLSHNAELLDAINLHMAEVPAAVEQMLAANAQALAQQALQVQKQEFDQRVNIVEHKVAYENLQSELMRAGAPEALLRDIAQGSVTGPYDPKSVHPSMGHAIMRGLEGVSVVNDVRFSALDKLAGEHARLEYERTGDIAAATQAGVNAVRKEQSADTGQAPLSGLSNQQVAEKAFQGYRDTLMKGSLTVASGNYAGPSQEYSPEDLMTAEQNQRQLGNQRAKTDAVRTPQNTYKAIGFAMPKHDYVSGRTQQNANRATRRTIDTAGMNMDLLSASSANIAALKDYSVRLDGWSPMSESKTAATATATQQNVSTPKSDPELAAIEKRTRQQRAQEAAQIRANKDGLLADEAKKARASAKEDTLDDVEFAAVDAQNAKAAKVDKLGERVVSNLLPDQQRQKQDRQQREQSARMRSAADKKSQDNAKYVGAGTAAGRDAASQISMGSSSGRSTGYNDRQDLATALTKSGQHGDVGVSNLTGYGTIRGSQQTKMLGEDPAFAPDAFENGSSGGGDNSRVICTELVRQGLMAPSLQRLDIAFTLHHLSPATVRGYHAWAVPYVRLMKRSQLATRLVEPLARWRAEEIAYRMKARVRPHYRGRVVRWVGEPLCWVLGSVLGWIGDPDRFYPQPRRR
ncbi:hypothetical protein [Magnetovibrio sp.]|uniref:hypothetical protein n=1 Tax=Magnetovibrio sp. TaxID=2024836 RepID=UPI002F922831